MMDLLMQHTVPRDPFRTARLSCSKQYISRLSQQRHDENLSCLMIDDGPTQRVQSLNTDLRHRIVWSSNTSELASRCIHNFDVVAKVAFRSRDDPQH